jgi:hypothetical protein
MKSNSIIGLFVKVSIYLPEVKLVSFLIDDFPLYESIEASWFDKADYLNDELIVSKPFLGEKTIICVGFKPGS